MKKFITSALLVFACVCCYAQTDQIKAEITALEQKGIQAILQKDSATLRKLWSPTFMVNAPTNMVVKGGQIEMVMRGQISYTSFTREMEEIMVMGDMVITMGHEKVVAVIGNRNGGQEIERRYTHIWEKKNGGWLLMARHANDICKP